MSPMFHEALKHYPYVFLNSFALLMFLGVFVGVIAWIFRKGASDFYKRIERLPLE